jgi:hypothetical protein
MNFFRPLDSGRSLDARASLDLFGFCAFPDLLDSEGHEALRLEALAQFESGCFSESREGLAYEAYLGDLGPRALEYLTSKTTLNLLETFTGRNYRLVTEKSCFTYYFEGGHLAPHLDDIPGAVSVSLLTYLLVTTPDETVDRSALDIYSRDAQAPGKKRTSITTTPASVILGYGAEVWHGRTMLAPDQVVVMINGSYGAIGTD